MAAPEGDDLGGPTPALPGPYPIAYRIRRVARRAWSSFVENARDRRYPAVLAIGWRDALIPLVFFATAFLWLGTGTSYLFGQDSYSFLYPFAYQSSPFVAVHYNAQSLYTYAFIDGLTGATGSPFAAERLVLAAFAGLSALGMVELFRVLNVVRGRPASAAWPAKFLGAAVVVWNPFTLSVAWQHVEGWTFFPVLLPYVLALLFEVHYLGLNLRRFALTVLVSYPLAPGAAGTYLFIFGYVFAFFLVLEVVLWLGRRIPLRTFALRALSYVATAVLISGWASVQYFGSPLLPTASSGSLESLFLGESGTTSLLNVLTLTAYSPIQGAPSYFPWISFLPWLVFAGLLMVLVTTVLVAHEVGGRVSILWGLLILPIVLAMTGANFPAGPVNAWLLSLGGPFDLLVNPYYFLAPYYGVFLGYVAYRAVDEGIPVLQASPALRGSARRHLSRLPGLADRLAPRARDAAVPRGNGAPTGTHGRRPTMATAVAAGTLTMLLVAVAVFATPFVTGQVYQSHGDYISEEQVPADYAALARYFAHDYPGPLYNVLVLPASSYGATYLPYNGDNSTFPDSEGLLESYIPYPTIWRDPSGTLLTSESPLYGAVENVTANLSASPGGLVGLLAAVHVRYVVVDQDYLPRPSMLSAPNGVAYNLGATERGLNATLGVPAAIGSFLVYTDLSAAPLVGATSFPDSLSAPSLAGYLNVVSDVSTGPSPTVVQALQHAIWTPVPVAGGFSADPYNGTNATYAVPSNDTTWYLLPNGSLEASTPGVSLANGTLRIAPTTLARGNLTPVYTSAPPYQRGCYVTSSTASSPLAMAQPVVGWPAFGVANLTLNLSEPGDLFTLGIEVGGSLFLSVSLQHHARDEYLLSGTANTANASYFGWNNTPFQTTASLTGPLRLGVSLTGQALTMTLTNAEGGSVTDVLYFAPGEIAKNAGSAPTNYPNGTTFDPAALGAWVNWTVGPGVSMCGASLALTPELQDVVFAPSGASAPAVSYTAASTAAGDYTLRIAPDGLTTVYVSLLSVSSGDWQVSLNGAALPAIAGVNPFHLFRLAVPAGATNLTVSIVLVNHVALAIEASYVELAGVGTLAAVLGVVARRRDRGPSA